ncbi:unnamed protein product, partial [Protopolystoma xenopodis]
ETVVIEAKALDIGWSRTHSNTGGDKVESIFYEFFQQGGLNCEKAIKPEQAGTTGIRFSYSDPSGRRPDSSRSAVSPRQTPRPEPAEEGVCVCRIRTCSGGPSPRVGGLRRPASMADGADGAAGVNEDGAENGSPACRRVAATRTKAPGQGRLCGCVFLGPVGHPPSVGVRRLRYALAAGNGAPTRTCRPAGQDPMWGRPEARGHVTARLLATCQLPLAARLNPARPDPAWPSSARTWPDCGETVDSSDEQTTVCRACSPSASRHGDGGDGSQPLLVPDRRGPGRKVYVPRAGGGPEMGINARQDVSLVESRWRQTLQSLATNGAMGRQLGQFDTEPWRRGVGEGGTGQRVCRLMAGTAPVMGRTRRREGCRVLA